MTTMTFNKSKFANDFKLAYDNADEYDMTLVFDEFFNNYIENNSPEQNKSLIDLFCSKEEIENAINVNGEEYYITSVDDLLYNHLFKVVEDDIADDYLSDYDTDYE